MARSDPGGHFPASFVVPVEGVAAADGSLGSLEGAILGSLEGASLEGAPLGNVPAGDRGSSSTSVALDGSADGVVAPPCGAELVGLFDAAAPGCSPFAGPCSSASEQPSQAPLANPEPTTTTARNSGCLTLRC